MILIHHLVLKSFLRLLLWELTRADPLWFLSSSSNLLLSFPHPAASLWIQKQEPAFWLKSYGLCLFLVLLFHHEDPGFWTISTLTPGHYLLRSPEEASAVVMATSLWGPVLGLIQSPDPGDKLQMALLFLDPGVLPMNEPVTWKSPLSLPSLFLTPSFPFKFYQNFPVYGTGVEWPRVNWAGSWSAGHRPWCFRYLLRLLLPRQVLNITHWVHASSGSPKFFTMLSYQ